MTAHGIEMASQHAMASCGKMSKRSSRSVPIREPFCPLGCLTPTGSTFRVGLGSCADCVSFNSQNVMQQGNTIALLIANEDAKHLKSSKSFIPPSPTKNREAQSLIESARKIVVGIEHQRMSGFGAPMSPSPTCAANTKPAVLSAPESDLSAGSTRGRVDTPRDAPVTHFGGGGPAVNNAPFLNIDLELPSAEEVRKQQKSEARALAKQIALESKKEAEKKRKEILKETELDLSDDDVAKVSPSLLDALLTTVLEIGKGIAIRNIADSGRGLASTIFIKKTQYICYYDGDRVDANTGQILMVCRRTRENILSLPQGVQTQLRALKYNKTWALTLNRGSNITKFGGTRDIVIDGTIAASRLLDHLVDRGLIGPGSLMNSSDKTGIPANCSLIFIPWQENSYSLANSFFPTKSEKMMAVIVAKVDIPPNTNLTWNYSYASHDFLSGINLSDTPGFAPGVLPLGSQHIVTVPISNDHGSHSGGGPAGDDPLAGTVVQCTDCVGKETQCASCQAENAPHVPLELTPVVPITMLEIRIRDAGKLKSSDLKTLVKFVMDQSPSIVPPEFRLTNVSNKYSCPELLAWCAGQAQRMESARLKRFKTSLCARDSVEACMRMLAIFCNDQYMQDLYLKSRTLPSQPAMDAGVFGDNHPFWSEMHTRFHSSDHFLPFPFDYIPTKIKFTNSQGFESEHAPPQVVEKGFLKGMDLLHARKPPQYAEYFFTKQKLMELWKKSLADYRFISFGASIPCSYCTQEVAL